MRAGDSGQSILLTAFVLKQNDCRAASLLRELAVLPLSSAGGQEAIVPNVRPGPAQAHSENDVLGLPQWENTAPAQVALIVIICVVTIGSAAMSALAETS